MRTCWRTLAAAALLVLAACGGKGDATATGGNVDVVVTTLAGSPAERHWQWFVTNVRSWAPEFRVALVPRTAENGLGSLSGRRPGIVHASPRELAGLVPELALLDQPLLFLSDAEADHVLDRHLLPEVRRRLDARGLALLAWTEGEPRVVYARDDGLAPSPSHDGSIVPLATHADVGAARPGGVAVLLDSGHVPGLVLAASGWFDPLTPHDEDVFRLAYATKDARADTRGATTELLAALGRDADSAVRVPTAAERARWREQWAPARMSAAAAHGADGESLLALIERGRAEFDGLPSPG